MKYSLYITKKAEDDLCSAADYIEFTLRNPIAAEGLLDKAEQELSALADMPHSHRLADDPALQALGIRYLQINNYMAFFTVGEEAKTVFILRFLYGKRNWMQILKDDLLSLS